MSSTTENKTQEKLVRDVMQHGVPTVSEEASLADVLKVFTLNNTAAVVVVDEFDESSGIVTQSDVLKAYTRDNRETATAEDIMTDKVFTASPVEKVSDAVRLMLEKDVEQLVVVHGHGAAKIGQALRPVALFTAANVISYMAETTEQ